MNELSIRRLGLRLALLAAVTLPGLAGAQNFTYNETGDVLAGFRQTGSYQGNYELVVDLGNVTNYLALPVGTTLTLTNYLNPVVLTVTTNAFTSLNQVQWSVFAGGQPGSSTAWSSTMGSFAVNTIWYTQPSTSATTQTTPPIREPKGSQQGPRADMYGVGTGAVTISPDLGATNVDNNTFLVREPVSYDAQFGTLNVEIADPSDSTLGDFGSSGSPLPSSVENDTGASFTSAQRNDFYQFVPTGYTDPLTGQTTGNAYLVGYFLFYPNGTLTFTRQLTSATAPVASFTGTPLAGFAPLTVTFTDSSSGSPTSFAWNFGDGNTTTTSSTSVSHTYSTTGSYTVTETVTGAGGTGTNTQTGYVVVSSAPKLGNATLSGANLVFSGTGGPAGVQYRILTSTNLSLPIASWTPVVTNTVSSSGKYGYTNSTAKAAAYFLLVSP